MNNVSTRRVCFVLGRSSILDKRTESPPIILDIGVHRSGDSIGVEAIRLWVIKLRVPGVVYKKDIGYGRTPNCSTIHGTCLIFGAGDVAVFCGVKVTNRVKGEP